MEVTQQFAVYPSLKGRVVLISGGANGIGEAMVEAFIAQGARVAFFDIVVEAGHDLAKRLADAGYEPPFFIPCDLTDTAALQAAFAQVLERMGSVDVLINNAANDTRHTLEEVTSERWDQLMAVNLKHQFFLAQAAVAQMRKQGGGCILNFGSIAWVMPETGLPVYTTAKAAVTGFTKTLAHLVGKDNIRVNCIMPGAILTERQKQLWFTPEYVEKTLADQALKHMILPSQVAQLALFLAADDSSAITGQDYIIDGGRI